MLSAAVTEAVGKIVGDVPNYIGVVTLSQTQYLLILGR
jgi:hypothetical protein